MAVDANIPLSGIAPKLPSAGELVSLQGMIEQMRERKLRSDQQTAELASDKALEGLAAGLSAYYGAPQGTTEDQRKVMMRTAQREYFEQLDKSGQGRLYGWNSQKIQEFAHHEIEPERAEMILDQTAKYKDLVKHGRNLRAGEIEAGPAEQGAPSPAQAAQGGVPLGQVGQPPQQPEVPMPDQAGVPPGQVALGVQPSGPNEFRTSTLPVTAQAPVETPSSLYKQAQDRDAKARQLRLRGLTEEAKTMAAEGQHFRTSGTSLEGRNQGDLRIEQQDKKIDMAMKRLELSQPSKPLTEEQSKLHGQEFLDTLGPGERDLIKGIAELDIDPNTVSKRNNQQERIIEYVKQYDPKYNMQDFKESQTAAVRFGSGRQGDQVRAFNVGLEHLDTLQSLTDALDSGNIKIINKAKNLWTTQTGGNAPSNFEAAKQVVAAEVVKAVVGGGGALTDREEAARNVMAASSPKQLTGVIETYKHLFGGQLHGLEQQYKSATKRKDFRDRYLTEVGRDAASSADTDVSKRGGKSVHPADEEQEFSEEEIDAEIARRRGRK